MDWTGRGLEGLRVIDVSHGVAGLFCAHRLHTLGADVATIHRGAEPAVAGFVDGLAHVARDEAVLRSHVAAAAVVIDDDAPEARRLAAALPADAVRVVITPFGRTGPYAGYTGTDLTAEAFGGALGSCGLSDRAPIGLGGRLVSTYVGGVAAAAAVAEVRLAAATGEGSVVDVSWAEALAASMDRRAVQLLTRSYTGWDAERDDGSTPPLVTGVYPCADGLVYVSLYGWHIRLVCELIGDPELAAFHERPSLALRQPGNTTFRAAVLGWLAARPTREAVEVAQGIGWPVIPANDLPDALDDPWLVATNLVHRHPDGLRLPGSGLRVVPAEEVA